MFLSALFQQLLCFFLHVETSGAFRKPLSQKEELRCFQQMRAGDALAREKLILHNMRLVAHIIKKYYTNQAEQEDLLSIGTVGLMKAVSTFDYEKGARFATYASRCIENEILMHFRTCRKQGDAISMAEPIDTDKDGNQLTFTAKVNTTRSRDFGTSLWAVWADSHDAARSCQEDGHFSFVCFPSRKTGNCHATETVRSNAFFQFLMPLVSTIDEKE